MFKKLAASPAQPVHTQTGLPSGQASDGWMPGAYEAVREGGKSSGTPMADPGLQREGMLFQ